MLIGSNLGSEFASLPSAPWSMEPPRNPVTGGSMPHNSSLQLSPTGMLLLKIFNSLSGVPTLIN